MISFQMKGSTEIQKFKSAISLDISKKLLLWVLFS